MASTKKLQLKLLVDKNYKKVIFAESDKDFVDIMLSFLTMPIGNIVRILNKNASLGAMDKLYESVENLNKNCFNTETCKVMLLNPLNSCRFHDNDLVLKVDDTDGRRLYTCKKPKCAIGAFKFCSSVANTRCGCGDIMDFESFSSVEGWKGNDGDGAFVKGVVNYIITDDLHVLPASTMAIQNVFEKLKIKDWDTIEEMSIDLDEDLLRYLLKRCLVSKSPLSDMYFMDPNETGNPEIKPKFSILPKIEKDLSVNLKKCKAKFIICKSSNTMVYAEAKGEGLVDLLLSFLTIPLGAMVKYLGKCSSIGCVDNLYRSVENLSADTDCIKSDMCKSALLDPKHAPFFGCSNPQFPINEMLVTGFNFSGCHTCYVNDIGTGHADSCEHGVKHVSLYEMNPKLTLASKEGGGGYAKKDVKFMITDELKLTTFSSLGSVQTLRKQAVDFANLEENEIEIGENEALNLLKACLTSKNPLSEVYHSVYDARKKQKQMCQNLLSDV